MINPEALELNIRLELAASREHGDDCFRCTYGLAKLILEYIEQTKGENNMKERYYKIGYGCGCGDNEDYIMAMSLESANEIAYEAAIEEYEMFEGLHGIRGVEDIAIDDYDIGEDDDIPDELYDQIYADYLDEREGQLDYWAEEITKHEYLVGIGAIDDDDYEDENDED